MARSGAANAHRRRSKANPQPAHKTMFLISILLLLDAVDDEETLVALAIAQLAISERRNQHRSGRYGRRGLYDSPKSKDFLSLLLDGFSDRWFQAWIRMDRKSFWHLHSLICDDPIFISTGIRPQNPPHHQLAAFLVRCGAESAVKTASVLSISEGSVHNYMYRVGRAFRNIREDHLAWPGLARRDFLSEEMEKKGFPGCLGSADGSYIRLADKPIRNGYAYWCRKKFYALIIQATVDHRGIFHSYDFGWPGSVQDSRVFKNSHLWLHRDEYFRQHEYILVDKGYPLTQFSIRPFNDVDFTNNPEQSNRRKAWNRKLSSVRIFVEHAFGRLKGRFPILRCLPGRDIPHMCRLIESLMIVHNILEEFGSDPTCIEGFNGREDNSVDQVFRAHGAGADVNMSGDELYAAGIYRRKVLVEYEVGEPEE